jgi:hypothetical protein
MPIIYAIRVAVGKRGRHYLAMLAEQMTLRAKPDALYRCFSRIRNKLLQNCVTLIGKRH